jgi:hypothetical protein
MLRRSLSGTPLAVLVVACLALAALAGRTIVEALVLRVVAKVASV